ncbi:MAG: hypothetical protein ACHQQR_04625 [Gemmatimonadales bacterium]
MAGDGWTIGSFARRALRRLRRTIRRVPTETTAHFSNLDEEGVIQRSLTRTGVTSRFCVDIAASDGTTMSNTYTLFRDGWAGIAVECDPVKFAKLAAQYASLAGVDLMKCVVTPDNVNALLEVSSTPREFGFLNLDIDGYDYFVLERILHRYRPRLICVEINEKIPPPLKFTVRWDPRYVWAGDHFYGASISKMYELCVAHHYALTELHYNSAFLVPVELSFGTSLTPEQAWRDGYRDRPDRREKYPWNANMDDLLTMTPADAIAALHERFRDRDGMYDLSL